MKPAILACFFTITQIVPLKFSEDYLIRFKKDFQEQMLSRVNRQSDTSKILKKKMTYLTAPVCFLTAGDGETFAFESLSLSVQTNWGQSYLIGLSTSGKPILKISGNMGLSYDLEGSVEIQQLLYVEKHLSRNPFVLTFPNLDTARYVGFFQSGSIFFLNPKTLQPHSIEDVILDVFGSKAKFFELMQEQRFRETLRASVWSVAQAKKVLQSDYLCYSKAFSADTSKVLDLFTDEVQDSLGLTDHQSSLIENNIKEGIRNGTLVKQLTPIWFYGYDVSFQIKRVLTNDQYQRLSLILGRKRFLCSRAEDSIGRSLNLRVYTEDGQYTSEFVKFVFEK